VRALAYGWLLEHPDPEREAVLLDHVRRGEVDAVPALVAVAEYGLVDRLLADPSLPDRVRVRVFGQILRRGDHLADSGDRMRLVEALAGIHTADASEELWVYGSAGAAGLEGPDPARERARMLVGAPELEGVFADVEAP
jgi:hypothetical protein